MPTTTSEPLTTAPIAAPTTIKESANEFTLPPDLELTDFPGDVSVDVAAATTADVADVAGEGDEILQNIIRSNERLAKELAKMPPLPKISSYKKSRSRAEAPTPIAAASAAAASATAATPASSKIKCFCPSFMRHRHEHEHIHTLRRRSSETSVACCRSSRNSSRPAATSASPAAATSGSKARTQTTHSKTMKSTLDTHHQHEHHRTTSSSCSSSTTAEPDHHTGCCHPCKTDPLPWLQQHLVLNQILSRSATACQPTCQVPHLTVDADGVAATSADATSTACRGPGSNALSASIKPKMYFEQLLRRDGCHKKPRPPVKVDVNVRLVPKQPKPKVTRSLNETFVKEVDEVAQALNETFVKETSPELAQIDEQLAELEDREQVDEETEEQEQATKL